MNSRIKELLQNTALFTVANIGSKLLTFLMVPLYTAVLSTEEYGISDLVQTTSALLYPLLTCMISEAVLRFSFLNEEYSIKSVFSVGVKFTFLSIIVCSILGVFFPYIPFFKSLGVYVFFIPVYFFTQSLLNLGHKFARGIDRVKVSAIAGLLHAVTIIVLNLFFLLVLKIGITGYLLSYILGDGVSILYIACKCRANTYWVREDNRYLQSQMLKYSLPLVPNSLSWWALSSVNRYIMLSVVGISVVGVYSATLRIPSILTVLSDIFAQAWLLSALKNYGTPESRAFIKAMHNRFFSILIVLTGAIILLSEPLAKILLSGEFSSYWYIIPYLFISVFWGALVGFLGSVFSAERKNTMQFVSTAVGAVVSVLFTILLLRRYGVIIVALATMLGYFVIWLVRRLAVNKYIDIGFGTFESILQGLVLLALAVLTSKGMYIWAIFCFILIILWNSKTLISIIKYGIEEVRTFDLNNCLHKNKR